MPSTDMLLSLKATADIQIKNSQLLSSVHAPQIKNFSVFKYFWMACWYLKIKSTQIFPQQMHDSIHSSFIAEPKVSNNSSSPLNFQMACRYLKIFVHRSDKFEICTHENNPFMVYGDYTHTHTAVVLTASLMKCSNLPFTQRNFSEVETSGAHLVKH